MQKQNHAVIRIAKQKTPQEIGASEAHNLRKKFVLNADQNREKDNRLIVGDTDPLLQTIQNEIERREIWRRPDSVLCVEAVLTATDFDGVNLESWIESNVKFLNDKFGKENILRVVLHLDESTPHLHANILPVVTRKDGTLSLNAKHYFGGKPALMRLQTEYSKAMAPHGLKRGVEGSVASHTDAKTYKRIMSRAVESLPAMLAKIKKICTPPYKVKHRDGTKEELDIKEMKPRLGLVAIEVAENNARLAKYQLRSLEKYAIAQAETIVAQQVKLEQNETATAKAKSNAQNAFLIATEERERARSATEKVAELSETIRQVNAFDPSIIKLAKEKANEQRNRKRHYSRVKSSTRKRNQESKPSTNVKGVDRANENRRNKLDRG